MNSNHWVRSGGLYAVLATLALCGNFWLTTAMAAEPEFVGILAIAEEEDVAKALGLTDQQKSNLLKVIDRREDEALELALELRDLSLDEREKRLAPFRQESEKQGLAVLTEEQVKLLQEIAARRPVAAPPSTPAVADVTETAHPARTSDRSKGPFYVRSKKPSDSAHAAVDPAVDPDTPPTDAVADDTASDKPTTMQFNFHHQPWKAVRLISAKNNYSYGHTPYWRNISV